MRIIGFIVTVLLLTFPALSQTGIKTTPQSLRLTTRIVDQKYCDSGYPDMAMLRLSLRLSYTNVSEQPLILYKGSNLMHYLLVGGNERELANKNYETNMHVGWITSGPGLAEDGKPGKEFVVLAPRKSYQTEMGSVSIPIDLNSTTEFLKAGEHVFQGVTETWPGTEQQFERLTRKWKTVGVLWGKNVRSETMPLIIDKSPRLVQCK